MAKEIKLTQESLDAYKDELESLKTTRADEVAEQLKEARSFGDLSENAEYDEAKNEQGKLYSRIAELEEIIKHAVVVTGDSYAADEVSPGCRFVVKDLEEDEEEEWEEPPPESSAEGAGSRVVRKVPEGAKPRSSPAWM